MRNSFFSVSFRIFLGDCLAGTVCLVFAKWDLNLSFGMVFAAFGYVHFFGWGFLRVGVFTFHFVWYLPHLGMVTFHFACGLLQVGVFSFHFAWDWPHLGMFTFKFAWDWPHFGMLTCHFSWELLHVMLLAFTRRLVREIRNRSTRMQASLFICSPVSFPGKARSLVRKNAN